MVLDSVGLLDQLPLRRGFGRASDLDGGLPERQAVTLLAHY